MLKSTQIWLMALLICSANNIKAQTPVVAGQSNNKVDENHSAKTEQKRKPLTSTKHENKSQQINPTDGNVEVIEVTAQNHYQSQQLTVINREAFINSSQNLTDILQQINGIQIRQISGIGNPSSVSIRGSTSKQVQVYIDGQLINDNQFGGFDLNQLPISQIQSIEVSKNQALGTGATPIGGTIRINTFKANSDTLRISAEHGSFGFNQANITYNEVFQSHNLGLGYSFIKSDNNFDYLVPQNFNNPSESIIEPLRNNQYRKSSWYLNDETQLGAHKLRFNVQHLNQDKSLPNYQNNSPQNQSSLNSQATRYGYQHNWQPTFDAGIAEPIEGLTLEQIEFQLYRQNKDEQYQQIPGGPIEREAIYHSVQDLLSIKPSLIIKHFAVTPFIDYQRQTFTSALTTNGQANTCNAISPCDIKAEQQQLTYGSGLNWQNTDGSLSAQLLVSQMRQQNKNVALNDPNATALKQKSHFDSQEGAINFKWAGLDNQLSIAKGVRAPTLFELFGDRGSFKGNKNLQAETATTYSFSSRYQQPNYQVSFSAYQQDQQNAIVAIFTSTGVGSYTNVANSTVKGIELQASYQFTPRLNVLMQGNYIDSRNHSQIVAFDNKHLPGIYHQQLSVGINYQLMDSLQFGIRTDFDQELYFNRANRFENESNLGNGTPTDRTLTQINLNWQYSNYNINLAINNLFDYTYQDLANRQAEGRNIQLKFSLEVF